MSGVHDAIAVQALAVLPAAEQRFFEPQRAALATSCDWKFCPAMAFAGKWPRK